jgi:hypothetical protein
VELIRKDVVKYTLVMIKVLCTIVLALHIDDDVAFLQDFRVPGACYGRIFVERRQAEEEDGEGFVGMESAATY